MKDPTLGAGSASQPPLEARRGAASGKSFRFAGMRGLGRGSLIVADDKLIILSEKGELVLADATPSTYREQARAQVLKGKCWTPPPSPRGASTSGMS